MAWNQGIDLYGYVGRDPWTAAAGVTAIADALLFLRRRDSDRQERRRQ
jgi:hypothetical protein